MRGDKALPYGRIMEVMGTITEGGFTKVALLAEQPLGAPPPAGRRRPPPTAPAAHAACHARRGECRRRRSTEAVRGRAGTGMETGLRRGAAYSAGMHVLVVLALLV